MELVAGARGRSLCLSELCGLSAEFAFTLQRIERKVEQQVGASFPRVGSLDPRDPLVSRLVAAIAAVDVGALATPVDPSAFLIGLGAAADASMPWQPPHPRDALATLPPVTDALRAAGEAIHAAPATTWWSTAVAVADQWQVAGEPYAQLDALRPARPRLRAIRDGMLTWEARVRAHPEDPARETSGEWWSKPGVWVGGNGANLPSSSRRLATIGAVELATEEDSFGPERAALRQLAPASPAVRVYEVEQPSDWQHLVSTYPFDVSRSRRGVWWQSTGIDGPWFVPDWLAVADDYDAVHVSVHGYLTTAGEALPVPGGRTVLAGWNPDVTFWLCDVVAGPTEIWRRTSKDAMDRWSREHP